MSRILKVKAMSIFRESVLSLLLTGMKDACNSLYYLDVVARICLFMYRTVFVIGVLFSVLSFNTLNSFKNLAVQ